MCVRACVPRQCVHAYRYPTRLKTTTVMKMETGLKPVPARPKQEIKPLAASWSRLLNKPLESQDTELEKYILYTVSADGLA